MQRFFSIPIVWLLAAAPSFAQGPFLAPLPTNPCVGGLPLVNRFIANEVGTDAGGPACPAPGSGCAETMVVCTHRGKTTPGADGPMDVVVEMFTASGAPAGSAAVCGVLPGGSAAFVTGGMSLPSPYTGTVIGGPHVVPVGSLRILTGGPEGTFKGINSIRVVCDVTSIDVQSIATGVTTVGPGATKGVKIIRAEQYQKGD
jgi:hypothetical protein